MSKIVLFTANVQGGILQFTLQIYKTLMEEGHKPIIYLPFEIKDCDISKIPSKNIVQFHKTKRVINQRPYWLIAKKIVSLHPDYVWYMDESVICANIGIFLPSSIRQLYTAHDAGTHHLTNKLSLRNMVLQQYTRAMNMFFYKKIYKFILLSEQSIITFKKSHSQFSKKIELLPLGAHLPDVESTIPVELESQINQPYILFFGRIDKYKGIANLLKAYSNVSQKALHLIIAGNGEFTKDEQKAISRCNNLTVIKRYIKDGEMRWLIENSTAVVLPYIEATQSGVIPLAYFLGKPVIVSNIPGLTQFVINKKTGFICDDDQDLEKALITMNVEQAKIMEPSIVLYYKQYLDWNRNIRKIWDKL